MRTFKILAPDYEKVGNPLYAKGEGVEYSDGTIAAHYLNLPIFDNFKNIDDVLDYFTSILPYILEFDN